MFCCPKKICNLKGKELFLFGMRVAFGLWLLYIGLMKWISGPFGFVDYLTNSFSATWAPAFLVVGLGWIILVLEPLVGLWLLSAKKQRLAWLASCDLMFLLMFGQTMLQEYATVANNWQYVVLTLACAALTDPECKAEESCLQES